MPNLCRVAAEKTRKSLGLFVPFLQNKKERKEDARPKGEETAAVIQYLLLLSQGESWMSNPTIVWWRCHMIL